MTSPTEPSHRERGSALTAAVSVLAGLGIIAAVIFALYYYLTPAPVANGQVLSLDVVPIHNVSGGGIIAGGISGQPETFNEIMVFANVALKNTGKVPIHLIDMDAYVYVPGGTIYQNGAASQKNFNRVFMAYPNLKSKEGKPLLRDTTPQPGQQTTGQLIFHYPFTLKQWQSHTKIHLVFTWTHQPNLVIKLKAKQTKTGWQH